MSGARTTTEPTWINEHVLLRNHRMQHQRQALLDEVASEAAIAGFDEAEVNDDNDDDDASDDEKRLPDGWIREDSRSNPGKFVYVHSESGTRCGKRPTAARRAAESSPSPSWPKCGEQASHMRFGPGRRCEAE